MTALLRLCCPLFFSFSRTHAFTHSFTHTHTHTHTHTCNLIFSAVINTHTHTHILALLLCHCSRDWSPKPRGHWTLTTGCCWRLPPNEPRRELKSGPDSDAMRADGEQTSWLLLQLPSRLDILTLRMDWCLFRTGNVVQPTVIVVWHCQPKGAFVRNALSRLSMLLSLNDTHTHTHTHTHTWLAVHSEFHFHPIVIVLGRC